MKFLISENKIKDVIFKFLDEYPPLNNVHSFEHKSFMGDWISYYYNANPEEYFEGDRIFSYFEDDSTFDSDVEYNFPLIVIDDLEVYNELTLLFTEKNVGIYVLDWINEKYDLNAVELIAG